MATIYPAEIVPEFAAISILALLQGLTEFLPISSSGHLVLAQAAMAHERPALALDVALHLGTLGSILLVYRGDFRALVTRTLGGDWRDLGKLALGSVPTAVLGLALVDRIEEAFLSARFAAWGLLITAAVLLVSERARRRVGAQDAVGPADSSVSWAQALLIGSAQALAIWPGISRSGMTIAAGMLVGLRPTEAARFSFLLATPAILGAALLKLPDAAREGFGWGLGPVLWATAFAGFVGWGALRVLLAFLGRGAFAWFAAYCVVLAAGVLFFA